MSTKRTTAAAPPCTDARGRGVPAPDEGAEHRLLPARTSATSKIRNASIARRITAAVSRARGAAARRRGTGANPSPRRPEPPPGPRRNRWRPARRMRVTTGTTFHVSAIATVKTLATRPPRSTPSARMATGLRRAPSPSATAKSVELRYPDRENTRSITAADTTVGTPSGIRTSVLTSPRRGKRGAASALGGALGRSRGSATAGPRPSCSGEPRGRDPRPARAR